MSSTSDSILTKILLEAGGKRFKKKYYKVLDENDADEMLLAKCSVEKLASITNGIVKGFPAQAIIDAAKKFYQEKSDDDPDDESTENTSSEKSDTKEEPPKKCRKVSFSSSIAVSNSKNDINNNENNTRSISNTKQKASSSTSTIKKVSFSPRNAQSTTTNAGRSNTNTTTATPTITTLDSTIRINTTTPNANNVATIPTSDTTTLNMHNVALPTTDNIPVTTSNSSTTSNDNAGNENQTNDVVLDYSILHRTANTLRCSSLCANTLQKYNATITWYNNHCGNFFDHNPNQILFNTVDWCYHKSPDVEPSTKVTTLYAIESVLKRLGKIDDIDMEMNHHLQEAILIFKHQSRKRVQSGFEKTYQN